MSSRRRSTRCAMTRRSARGCPGRSMTSGSARATPNGSGVRQRKRRISARRLPTRIGASGEVRHERSVRRFSLVAPGKPDHGFALDPTHGPAREVLEDGIRAGDPVRQLRRGDLARRALEMRLPVHVPRPPAARMPDLRVDAARGAVLQLRRDGTPPGAAMRLTARCIDLLRILRAARWLTTSQVRRRFFPRATLSAARRRLRRLAAAGYVRKHQENRMREAMFTLGQEAIRVLEAETDGGNSVALERRPPKQLEHLAGINDIRIAAELCGQLSYFFAAWELPGIGWKHPIVPDAIFRTADRTFAIEYDRGGEGLRYFIGSKEIGRAHV